MKRPKIEHHWSLLLGLMIFCAGRAVMAQPNIIHIVADDLGWNALSSAVTSDGNGSTFHQTPNLDQMASQGMAFTSAYAMPTCVPTRIALLTGQSSARTQSYSVGDTAGGPGDLLVDAPNVTTLTDGAVTLAETMKTAGYTTAHFGKFHIAQSTADITAQHGFDFDFGGGTSGAPGSFFPTQQGQNWTYSNAVGPALDAYADPYTQAYVDANIKPYANGADVDTLVGTSKHLTDATTDAAIDFINGQVDTASPFYMNLSYHAVHTPIESRPDLVTKYNQILADNGGVSPDSRHTDPEYAALLEGLDQSVGRLVAHLHDPNGDGNQADSIADNTVLMFYGDNGGAGVSDDSPLRAGKGSAYEGGVRVPLIAWMPGTIAAGSTSDVPVQAADFYPTFAELGGASLPNGATHRVDGESLVGLLNGTQTNLRREGVFTHYPIYNNTNPGPLSSVVLSAGDTRQKLYYLYEKRTFEVYDLRTDISEVNNLADGNMSVLDYKLAARGIHALHEWLEDSGAVYPTVQASGATAPAPQHLPAINFALDESLDGLTTAQIDKLGVTLTISATGDGAAFDADATGVGVASDLDSGGATQRRRINGSYSTPETIEFSFNTDVMLKGLDLGALNTTGAESVLLSFVSGDNPFPGLNGYDANGFSLGTDSLTFDGSSATSTDFVLEFGILDQDEIFLTAGTVLSLTADPAVGGGVLLNAISIAQPLAALEQILLDYDLDGDIGSSDLALWRATYGSTTDLRADGNGNGVIDGGDFLLLQRHLNSGSLLGVASTSIPEPSGLVIVVGMAMILGSARGICKSART